MKHEPLFYFIFFFNIPGANTEQHTSRSVVLTIRLITAFVFVSGSGNRVNKIFMSVATENDMTKNYRNNLFRATRKENI